MMKGNWTQKTRKEAVSIIENLIKPIIKIGKSERRAEAKKRDATSYSH